MGVLARLVVVTVAVLAVVVFAQAKVGSKVRCSQDMMRVEVPISGSTRSVYLQQLRDYPDASCRPTYDTQRTLATLELSLKDVYRCGITRVVNKITGKRVYYHTVIIETSDGSSEQTDSVFSREVLHVKCVVGPAVMYNHTVAKRNVLPAGFQEPEDLEITTSLEERAPEPILGVGVRQNGALVTGELNVSPGTPLQMEIFLDKGSAPVYGLLVTHMQVTDTKAQEETIIFNGCSVDPYLFENFNTLDGDFLTAKFRAFKFPESTYVQFRGTVNVCLDKCRGIECSDGQIGFGRRKRAIPSLPADPNKIFEITITSFIKVNYDDESENFEEELRNKTKQAQKTNKLIVGSQKIDEEDNRLRTSKTLLERPAMRGKAVLTEEMQYTAIVAETSSSWRNTATTLSLFVGLMACFY